MGKGQDEIRRDVAAVSQRLFFDFPDAEKRRRELWRQLEDDLTSVTAIDEDDDEGGVGIIRRKYFNEYEAPAIPDGPPPIEAMCVCTLFAPSLFKQLTAVSEDQKLVIQRNTSNSQHHDKLFCKLPRQATRTLYLRSWKLAPISQRTPQKDLPHCTYVPFTTIQPSPSSS